MPRAMHLEVRANQEMLSARLDQRDRGPDEHLDSGSGLARAGRSLARPDATRSSSGRDIAAPVVVGYGRISG